MGCGVAKYRLGKLYLYGKDVPQDVEQAVRWLEASIREEDNPFSEYLLPVNEENIKRKVERRSYGTGYGSWGSAAAAFCGAGRSVCLLHAWKSPGGWGSAAAELEGGRVISGTVCGYAIPKCGIHLRKTPL